VTRRLWQHLDADGNVAELWTDAPRSYARIVVPFSGAYVNLTREAAAGLADALSALLQEPSQSSSRDRAATVAADLEVLRVNLRATSAGFEAADHVLAGFVLALAAHTRELALTLGGAS
jgi:hypothetical protein